MDFKTTHTTLRALLSTGAQFVIPRFQRDYSWERKHYKEFFDDILKGIDVNCVDVYPKTYFFGTMLFIGNPFENNKEIQVVDGQQRLTTITILFSALATRLSAINEELGTQLFRYIMAKNDVGKEVRILKTETSYPFFSMFIQVKNAQDVKEPETEEEKLIKETYDYFYKQLEEKTLLKTLSNNKGITDTPKYIDLLNAMRDQVLNSFVVIISANQKQHANMIFEILNAKGKKLASIDLIKNKIFEKIEPSEAYDFAYDKWSNIKLKLSSRHVSANIEDFFRHYWNSKYGRTTDNQLYDQFNSKVKDYKEFLNDMLRHASIYIKIIDPSNKDYDNRKEHFPLVQSLNVFNSYFKFTQIRIILLALFDANNRGIIDMSKLKKIVYFLEGFNFAYNVIVPNSPNKLEGIYSTFSKKIRTVTKDEFDKLVKTELYDKLEKIYPSYEAFVERFITVTYSKQLDISNMKAKYITNRIHCYYNDCNDLFPVDGTMEHILPETIDDDLTTNIGNIILLETDLNRDAKDDSYSTKTKLYSKSKYIEVQELIKNNRTFDDKSIEKRAKDMALLFWTKILNRKV